MPRAQQNLKRLISSQTFTDSTRIIVDLPRDYDLATLGIRISGNVVVTTGYTSVLAEAPLQALKLIQLKANGSDLLDSLTGTMANRGAGLFRRGQIGPVLAPTAASNATYPISALILLDRALIDGVRPKDANFPANGLSTFQIDMQFDASSALFTGAGVSTFSGCTVDIFVVQTAEQYDAQNKRTLPKIVTKRTQLTQSFPASNSNFQQRINTGNLLRGLVLRASIAGAPSNAVINRVKIQHGNQVLFDLPYADLRDLNATEIDVTSLPTGFCIVDFANLGGPAIKLSDFLNLTDGSELYLFLDVTGGSNYQVDILTLEAVPYNPVYWGQKQ